jgi:stress response protein YsnF
MTQSPHAAVMGLFRDQIMAEHAVRELEQTDWGVENVRLLSGQSSGIFKTLKHTMTGRDTSQESVSDALAAFDLPADLRQFYEHAVEHGSVIVIAYLMTHLLEARDVLNRSGAYQVVLPLQLGGEQIIPLRQEVAQIQKYVVDVGEIRIHKRVITEEKTFTVPVTREEVTIERFPLHTASSSSAGDIPSGDATVTDIPSRTNTAASFSEGETEMLREAGTIRIVVREEQVHIHKQPVVVEEIVIQKQVVQETAHLVEPLRHEEARLEQLGAVSVHEQRSDAASSFPPHERT